MPHKVAALSLVDEVDEMATVIGCINTIVNDGGRLRGYNTDGLGALSALTNAGIDPTGRKVTILGSGGAARAIAATLALRAKPSELTLLGVVEKELFVLGEDLRERTSARVTTQMLDQASLAEVTAKTEILLHCSPIGMTPNTEATLVPKSLLRSEMAVFDAVYNPRRTRLIQDAALVGCRVVEGMEMFLGQAMFQFHLWTGCEAPAAVMRQVIEARL
jgi:shikimate dehydrogenase